MYAYQLYRQGRAALDLDDHESALRLFLESLAIDEHFKTHSLLAEVYTRLGNESEAFIHAERAYVLSPVNDAASIDFAERLAARGEVERAMKIAHETLARNRTYGPAQMLVLALRDR